MPDRLGNVVTRIHRLAHQAAAGARFACAGVLARTGANCFTTHRTQHVARALTTAYELFDDTNMRALDDVIEARDGEIQRAAFGCREHRENFDGKSESSSLRINVPPSRQIFLSSSRAAQNKRAFVKAHAVRSVFMRPSEHLCDAPCTDFRQEHLVRTPTCRMTPLDTDDRLFEFRAVPSATG